MRKIAITGGIGVGKSCLCQILIQWGYPVISADEQAKKALSQNSPVYLPVMQLFKKQKFETLETYAIAEKIFSDSQLKKSFEDLVHPYIFQCIQKKEKWLQDQGYQTIFYEIPLLFEKKLSYYFNFIILMICPKNLQKQRIMKRMNISSEQALKRIEAQSSHETKIASSNMVIENHLGFKELEKSAHQILEILSLQKGNSC